MAANTAGNCNGRILEDQVVCCYSSIIKFIEAGLIPAQNCDKIQICIFIFNENFS